MEVGESKYRYWIAGKETIVQTKEGQEVGAEKVVKGPYEFTVMEERTSMVSDSASTKETTPLAKFLTWDSARMFAKILENIPVSLQRAGFGKGVYFGHCGCGKLYYTDLDTTGTEDAKLICLECQKKAEKKE